MIVCGHYIGTAGAGHLEHGHGQVGVQADQHHRGDHSGCHETCRPHLGAGGGQEEEVAGEQQREDEACGGAVQAAAEGHVWLRHREGDGGLDVRLIQQHSFFMFTFMIFSNT